MWEGLIVPVSHAVLMHIAIADIGMRFLAYCNNVKFDQSLNNIYESITGIGYKQMIFYFIST